MTFPPPRKGHVKSDNTHTIIIIHPLAHKLNICALIFSSCPLFTGLSQPHHVTESHPLQVITTRARKGVPKEHRAKEKTAS